MTTINNDLSPRVLNFIRLLNTSSSAEHRRRAVMETKALVLYRKFLPFDQSDTSAQAQRIARQLANEFPASIFTVAAIGSAADSSYTSLDVSGIIRFLQSCLVSMQEKSAPSHHRILVLRNIVEFAELGQDYQLAYKTNLQIEQLSAIPYEKSRSLLLAAKALTDSSEKDSQEQAQQLLFEVMAKYPNLHPAWRERNAWEARRLVIMSLLRQGEREKALETIRQFEKSATPDEINQLLIQVEEFPG